MVMWNVVVVVVMVVDDLLCDVFWTDKSIYRLACAGASAGRVGRLCAPATKKGHLKDTELRPLRPLRPLEPLGPLGESLPLEANGEPQRAKDCRGICGPKFLQPRPKQAPPMTEWDFHCDALLQSPSSSFGGTPPSSKRHSHHSPPPSIINSSLIHCVALHLTEATQFSPLLPNK